MPTKRVIRFRSAAFTAQNGLCCYCLLPMWHRDQERFCTQHNLTPGDTQFLQCTAEHLVARKDGGGDDAANIAAAHLICNRGRHQRKKPLEVDRYRMLVRTRVREGRWHQPHVLRALGD